MYYKNYMPQFPHLPIEGGREWQSHQLYFVYSDNGKKPIHIERTSNNVTFSLSNTVVLETFSPLRSMKKALKLRERHLSYYFITFHCIQNKTGFFLKVLYHLKKRGKENLIKKFDLFYLFSLCGFILH